MRQALRVALLIDTATTWGSGLIQGIAEYAHQSENWLFFVEPRGKYDRMTLPAGWNGDGVIARITHSQLAEQIVEAGIPAVNVSWYPHGEGVIPRCTCDEQLTGRLAAQYFIDRGFRQFAYCGSSLRPNYVDRFGEAFVDALEQRGSSCHSFRPQFETFSQLPWTEQLKSLADWLTSLPKPIGLLAYDDVQGRQVTEACEYVGIHVPHEVAVLGGEQDNLSWQISRPPLSSIDQAPGRVGYEAAALLSRLMRREPPPPGPTLIPPTRIVTRQSTDTVAIDDDLLAAAVRFIKDHCHEHIQVGNILAEVPISRRALEKGLRKHLGRSPAEEIRRVRVERAVQLLCDTKWPMPRIAVESGFERPELLTRAFRRELSMTPTEFRRRHRAELVGS
jgi:LacI family transcriptional regulator